MSWYAHVIFPRICDFILGQPFVARRRRELLAQVQGEVLEIGFGTGLNLSCYPDQVRRITTVDPNVGMHRFARRRIKKSGIAVDHHVQSSERLPFGVGRFDFVVSTFTLCSIEQADRALAEVLRVLKPGGRFLFLEHGLDPDPAVQIWQRRLNWLERRLADGCRLDRNIHEMLAAQPFASLQVDQFDLERIPRTHGHMYRGTASK